MKDRKVKPIVRSIFSAVLFLAIFAALLAVFSAIAEKTAASEMEGKRHRIKDYVYTDLKKFDDDSIDIIVAGDSLAFTSFSPMQVWRNTGIPGYVASITGGNMVQMESVVRAVLKTQSPKVLFMETHPLKWPIDGSVTGLLAEEEAKKAFPLFRYHNLWKNFIVPPEKSRRFFNGFRIMTGQYAVDPKVLASYMAADDGTDPDIQPEALSCMKKIGDLCREHGETLILYSAPSPRDYDMRSHNTISKLADEMGVDYFDANLVDEEIGINWVKDTNDHGDHLNLIGATKLSKYMMKYLKEAHPGIEFQDRRDDPAYAVWNKRAKKFRRYAVKYLRKMEGSERALEEFA